MLILVRWESESSAKGQSEKGGSSDKVTERVELRRSSSWEGGITWWFSRSEADGKAKAELFCMDNMRPVGTSLKERRVYQQGSGEDMGEKKDDDQVNGGDTVEQEE